VIGGGCLSFAHTSLGTPRSLRWASVTAGAVLGAYERPVSRLPEYVVDYGGSASVLTVLGRNQPPLLVHGEEAPGPHFETVHVDT